MKNKNKNNFNNKVQMHLACIKGDKFGKEMECIYFKDGFAYASDGVILVKNRISEISGLEGNEISALDGKFLHADFYKDMIKYDNIMIAEDGIECSKNGDKMFFYFSKFDKYKNVDKILQNALNEKTIPLPQVSFDINLMQRLNKALFESEKCIATFKGTKKPIVFSSIYDNVSSIGLIMPYYSNRLDDK